MSHVSPLAVQAERRHAGGTVEDGVAAGQRLSVSRVGLGTRHRRPVSAVVPAEEWTPAFVETGQPDVGKTNSGSPPPPGVHPGLVPVVLVRVVQQLVVAFYDPLFLPAARRAPCKRNAGLGYRGNDTDNV